ncbi:MAG: cyclic nucleotide-binding domain-containing protein [Acidobacteria bacterium]|nr:cyclic nucleotide-binding domain-containing protein [Acidobacteriota bacterium]
MNTSVIRYRVADFFKRFAPFDTLPHSELLDLAGTGRVKFHESDEYVFWQGKPRGPSLWIVQQGRVELIDARSGQEELRDLAGEGDIIGLDTFLNDGSYAYSARTSTDVILYSIDAAAFDELARKHAVVERFRNAHRSVTGSPASLRSWLDAPPPPMEFIAGRQPTERPSPAPLSAHTTRDAVRNMVRYRAESVTLPTHPPQFLSAADLSLFCDRNPALLLHEVRNAPSGAVLRPLLEQARRMINDGLSRAEDVDDCALLATEFAAAATAAAIALATRDIEDAGLTPPISPHCWVSFGAQARGELLRLTHPRAGVIYDGADPDAHAYFAAAAGRLHDYYLASGLDIAGDSWPEGCHPSMPFDTWRQFYAETIREPWKHNLFARRELFDLRLLAGETSLLHALSALVASELKEQGSLIPLLANDTLANQPPLTFFRGLVLDAEGHESAHLDLHRLALQPVSDAARVFTLGRMGLGCINTLDRLMEAAKFAPAHAEIFHRAADAFRIALYHQTRTGSATIAAASLSRYDQRLFKTAFQSILKLLELTTATFVGSV